MRDLNFYQQVREPKRKTGPTATIAIDSPWLSKEWRQLTCKYEEYPYCAESRLTFQLRDKSIRSVIRKVRLSHLKKSLPTSMSDIGPIQGNRICYRYPKPFEKINARICVFGSKQPAEVPEKFVLVIHFFSAESNDPITSYAEEVNCVFH